MAVPKMYIVPKGDKESNNEMRRVVTSMREMGLSEPTINYFVIAVITFLSLVAIGLLAAMVYEIIVQHASSPNGFLATTFGTVLTAILALIIQQHTAVVVTNSNAAGANTAAQVMQPQVNASVTAQQSTAQASTETIQQLVALIQQLQTAQSSSNTQAVIASTSAVKEATASDMANTQAIQENTEQIRRSTHE